MTKSNTKKSLVASGLSLAVSAALLLGTTFAWFTDSVTSAGNKIQAGNLAINAYAYDLAESGEKGFTIAGVNGGKEFYFETEAQDLKESDAPIINDTLFEPGKSNAKLLTVSNDGTLAAKVKLEFSVEDGGLMNALWFDFVQVKNGQVTGQFQQRPMSELTTMGNLELPLLADENISFILVYGMYEEAGNEYQGDSFSADVTILATQYTSEEDGFGSNQYDKDAVYQQANVEATDDARANGTALQQAIANAEEGTVIYVESGTYDLPRDTAAVEGQSGWYFAIDTDNLTIVGEEGTVLTSSEYSANGNWSSQNLVTIFGDNVTLENLTIKSKMDTNKAIEVLGKNSTIRNVQVLCNDITTHEEYLSGKGIAENSETDYWDFYNSEFAGSLYYNGDIGNATLENFYIDKAWISTGDVTNGTVSMTDVTIGYAGSGYADSSLPVSANASSVLQNGSELTVEIDNAFTNWQGLVDRLPQGATISLAAGSYALNSFSLDAKEIVIAGTEGVTLAPQQNASSDFGAIVIQGTNGGKLTVRDVTIAGSASNDGSRGICFSGQGNTDAELVVENCDISNVNTGIFLGGVANATITGCTFTNCGAGIGGSEQITGQLKVDTCTFSGNGETIGWAGTGSLVITGSPTCENFMDYTKIPADKITVTNGEYSGN